MSELRMELFTSVIMTLMLISLSLILVPFVEGQTTLMPAMFIFGDSLVDPGNNNYIATLAKSNFAPNGIDFPGGQATGRFCNGRTVADVISQKMNLPFTPAYLDPSTMGTAVLQGVNYASAAGGILDGTGANYVGRVGMNQQLMWFQNTKIQFEQLLTPSISDQVLEKSLYYVTIGSNDYINNYLLADSPTRPFYTPQQYEDYLISEYSKQLTELYRMGARKIFVFNVGPLGCIPSQLAIQRSSDGSCIEFINGYVRGFNNALRLLLDSLAQNLNGSSFVYGNAYDLVYDKVQNPGNYGLTTVNEGCCGVGQYNGQLACLNGIQECADRSQYLFWDPFHPTDAVNEQLGTAFFSGPTSAISPYNIQELAAMP